MPGQVLHAKCELLLWHCGSQVKNKDSQHSNLLMSCLACSLSAQLARTEEAAKRVITLRDPSAKGGAASRLLDAERALAKTDADRAEAQAAATSERKRSMALKRRVSELQSALESARKDHRLLARQLGASQASQGSTGTCIWG